MDARFVHSTYGIKSNYRFSQQLPMVNDEIPIALATGRVVVRPDIRRLTKSGVEFDDGSVEDDIDAIIYATGYVIEFPFFKEPAFELSKLNDTNLYKAVFAPDIKPATLAVIDGIELYGTSVPVAEMHSRWAVAVFKVIQLFYGPS